MSETETKTRYTVGETIYGINFAFDNFENIMFRLPYLYDMREVTAINIIPLVVKEHHKVPNEWADVSAPPDCDGFVLSDDKELVWHNQYPKASYGQISDESNRRFSRCLEGYVIDDLIKAGEVLQVHLLTDVIGNIRRAIKHFETPEIKADLEKETEFNEFKQRYDLLVKLNDDITKKFNEDFKKDFKEVAIWEAHPDITHFVVVDLES